MICDRDCIDGFIPVQEGYVERLAAGLTVPGAAAALRNSVFPCPSCRPAQFARWSGGHLNPDHDSAGCPDCVAGRHTGGHPRKRTRGPSQPPLPNTAPGYVDDGPEPQPHDDWSTTRRDLA